MKTIRDAVHGDLDFTDDELQVINTACFQRLRGIKQLGAAYLVYPSATHTRFEHSLGTCGVARQIVSHIRRNCGARPVSADDERLIAIYALVHDLTHIPFGHTIEDERRVFPRHDQNAARIDYFLTRTDTGRALAKLGVARPVEELMKHKRLEAGGPAFHYDIVSGTICADLLDYLERDSYFTGLSQKYDERLYKYFVIDQGGLAINLIRSGLFRMDGLSETLNVLRMRYVLSERCYYHPAKNAASAMVSKALELCVDSGKMRLSERSFYDVGDEGFLRILQTGPGPAKYLVDAFLARRLYKKVYLVSRRSIPSTERFAAYHLDPARRAEAEAWLARKLKVPFRSVVVYCPSSTMQLREANARFKLAPGEPPRRLEGNQEIENLKRQQENLWKFFVFLDPAYADKSAAAGQLCEEYFGQANELPELGLVQPCGPTDPSRKNQTKMEV
ncbi:MAG: HD domain-containing protein [candidate division WOR-3 bacterium]